MDEAKLEKQFKYLRMLKALNVPELRKVHKEIFPKGHRFYAKIPMHMHRSIIERRLFYYFAASNYHFPDKHPLTKEFRRKARHILSNGYVNKLDEIEEAQQAVRDLKKIFAPLICKS